MRGMVGVNIVGMVVLLLTGCTQDLHFVEMEKSFTERISTLNLDARDRRVVVNGIEDENLLFRYQDSEREILDFELTETTLDVDLVIEREFGDFFGIQADVSYRSIEIYVPQDSPISLNISTTNEYVSIEGISVEILTISNNNGDITFTDITSTGDISLSTKNADITGNIIGSYDDYAIDVDIKKGDTNLPISKESGSKRLSISNNNGDVFVDIEPE